MTALLVTTSDGTTHAVTLDSTTTVSVQGDAGSLVVSDVVRVDTFDAPQADAPAEVTAATVPAKDGANEHTATAPFVEPKDNPEVQGDESA